MTEHKPGIYEKYIKRVLDIICALLAIIVFSWLYVLIAILVKIKLGSPVVYSQERPGKIDPKTGEERIFKLYKFRTMTDERDKNGNLLPDEQRLTPFSRALRKSSLDELMSAFCILGGSMSVVGPRPLLVKYIPRYTDEQRKRHLVKPGLSGWAQINGRNAITWEEKFKYDVEYVEKISFKTDLMIIAKTVVQAFFKREGINSDTAATMEEFMGTDA